MRSLRLIATTLATLALSSVPVASQVTEDWVVRYDAGIEPTPIGTDDIANAIACDLSGNVYVTGQSLSERDSEDCVTIKYDPHGGIVWEARYEGPAGGTDRPHAIAVDASGCVYLCGDTSDGVSDNCLTIKYSNESVTAIEEPASEGGEITSGLALHAPRPNPSRGSIDVSFVVLREGGAACLAVYSVRGGLVRVLTGGEVSPGLHAATWDGTDARGHRVAAGVYFVRLLCRGDVRVRKVVVLS